MLIKQPQIKFVERTITSRDGREAIVLVALTISEGQIISARIVSVKPTKTSVEKTDVKTLAPIFEKFSAPVSQIKNFVSVVSPYLSLIFLTSQPTRAPNFAF